MIPLLSFLGRLLYEDNAEFRKIADSKERIKNLVDGNSLGISSAINESDIEDMMKVVDLYY